MTKIIKFTVDDIRFLPSKDLTGSDAIHKDPGYSIEMKKNSVTEFSYPNVEYWRKN